LQSAVTIKGEAHRYAPKAIPELDQAVGLARLALGLLENLSYMDRLLGGEDLLSHAARIHLGEVVQDVRGIFTALARVKNLQMEVDAVAWNAQDRRLWGDRGLIAQLVFNLIHNALRYARADTTVRVYGGEEKGRIFLTVADVGLRIPPDQRERVFDRGYRTSKARAMDPSGTGLGLWLVRRICDLHRAEIKCEEEEYHEQIWTVFRVWFPPAGAGGGRPGLRDEATLGVDPGPGL
ncbi:MAG TPA: HAMP domain-containing sensor histidine kinase, partial [Myxococcota bacterium]|nr:HAMP domain-containing sensor histidine kinase [Myxococcota bacterium]